MKWARTMVGSGIEPFMCIRLNYCIMSPGL